MRKRIGVLGGSFDPVHLGHTDLANTAIEELGLEMAYMMPARVQPFKRYAVTSQEDRLAMLELAILREEKLVINKVELMEKRVSYTYDTFVELKKDIDQELVFIMGSDSMMALDTWYKGEALLREASFAVGLRPSADRRTVESKAEELRSQYGASICLLRKTMLPLSSTMIRERIERGAAISGLVTPEVEDYIHGHGLYT